MKKFTILVCAALFANIASAALNTNVKEFTGQVKANQQDQRNPVEQESKNRDFDKAFAAALWVLRAPVFARPADGYSAAEAELNTLAHRVEVANGQLEIMVTSLSPDDTERKDKHKEIYFITRHAAALLDDNNISRGEDFTPAVLEQKDADLFKEYKDGVDAGKGISGLSKTIEKILTLKYLAEKNQDRAEIKSYLAAMKADINSFEKACKEMFNHPADTRQIRARDAVKLLKGLIPEMEKGVSDGKFAESFIQYSLAWNNSKDAVSEMNTVVKGLTAKEFIKRQNENIAKIEKVGQTKVK